MVEENIWRELLEVDSQGCVVWIPKIRYNLPESDYRNLPVRFMSRCGNLREFNQFTPRLGTEEMIKEGNGEFLTSQKENVRVDGLLRLVDKFPVSLTKPERLTLIGALTPNSLFSVLFWLKKRGWLNCNVSVIDKSTVPIETLKLMAESGYIKWNGGLKLEVQDVFDWRPKEKQSLIIGDILNTWIVPHYYDPKKEENPYKDYCSLLISVKRSLAEDGWFLSRCLVLPSKDLPNFSPGRMKSTAQKTKRIINQLGEMGRFVDERLIEKELRGTTGYPPPRPRSNEMVSSLRGQKAEAEFIELHNEVFETVHLITVRNQLSGYCHQNFLCQISE